MVFLLRDRDDNENPDDLEDSGVTVVLVAPAVLLLVEDLIKRLVFRSFLFSSFFGDFCTVEPP